MSIHFHLTSYAFFFLAKPGDPFEDLFGSLSLSFPMMGLLKNYVMLFQPGVHFCRLCEDYSITAGGWRLCLQELCSFGCHRVGAWEARKMQVLWV